jgi:glycosyltransferase involved in cell wall biosynthesis
VREETLGLTHARVRGIKESAGELIVFLDDDNVAAPDYLEKALDVSRKWPILGVWGGDISARFDVTPEQWTRPYWMLLAIAPAKRDTWTNCGSTPVGAGMCLRASVARRWLEILQRDPLRLQLGRIGAKLTSCDDGDIGRTAIKMGLGSGQFTNLKLTHLIPPNRLQEPYLLRLAEAMANSVVWLDFLEDRTVASKTESPIRHLLDTVKCYFPPNRGTRFFRAYCRGRRSAFREIRALVSTNGDAAVLPESGVK